MCACACEVKYPADRQTDGQTDRLLYTHTHTHTQTNRLLVPKSVKKSLLRKKEEEEEVLFVRMFVCLLACLPTFLAALGEYLTPNKKVEEGKMVVVVVVVSGR